MRRTASCLLALLLACAACGDDDGGDEAAPEVFDTAPVESTAAPGTTGTPPPTDPTTPPSTVAVDEDTAALCGTYLDYLTAQDGAAMNTALGGLAELLGPDGPSAVVAAVETLGSGDIAIDELFAAQDALEGYIGPICDPLFLEGVTGVAEGEDVVTAFFDAVVAGDRATAASLAPADVVAVFEPWEPIPPSADVDAPTVTGADSQFFTMLLAPTVTVYCEHDGSIVRLCAFGE